MRLQEDLHTRNRTLLTSISGKAYRYYHRKNKAAEQKMLAKRQNAIDRGIIDPFHASELDPESFYCGCVLMFESYLRERVDL